MFTGVAPAKPGDKTFAELTELIQNHHNPKPSEIIQRFKFMSRVRSTGESISTFVSELRRLAADCFQKLQGSKRHVKKGLNAPTGKRSANYVDNDESEDMVYSMFRVCNSRKEPYFTTVNIEGIPVKMEIDTGASVTVISKARLQQLEKDGVRIALRVSTIKLKTYTGEQMPILGQGTVQVEYEGQKKQLPIVVVKGNGPGLLGRDWLSELKLNWTSIFHLHHREIPTDENLELALDANKDAFKEGLGTLKGVKAKIYVDKDVKPLYFKARSVPHALREKIEKELDRLEKEGNIEAVQFSEWATPIVPIVKSDKSVRICGDYKVTVNTVSKLDNYPIPKIEDLYVALSGGKEFTKLDLSQAYQQMELDEDSKQYTTINTHKGIYRYNRLPYGISSAPGIFQRTMENLLQGIPHVVVRIDDILVTGKDRSEHLNNLNTVLKIIREAGMHLKRSKCEFLAKKVVYLGYTLTEKGIQPVQEKVKAISEMPEPTNVQELQAYLGMLNFYHKFLPNLSTVLAPLHDLLVKGAQWVWTKGQANAFEKSKELLMSAHFDPKQEIVVYSDASPYGIGAMIGHRMSDGTEKPVSYVSRTLAPAERNYSHLEKEGLAVVFAVKKFHQYLYGNKFTVYTDHKPLLGLLKEDRRVPEMAAARIQRWALTLAAYEYTLEYKEGSKNKADGLSRLPVASDDNETPIPGEIILAMEHLQDTPITADQVKTWTEQEPILAKVVSYVKSGWPAKCNDTDMKPYFTVKDEMSVENGCLLRGNRVVIPLKGQAQILQTLHEGHPGINRMKSLARGYVWWPRIDSDLEEEVKACSLCQLNRKAPPKAPLHPWEWPSTPWSRVHIDYAGPFLGKMMLIAVDAYSKWIEVCVMTTSTSQATIEKLRQIFATQGLPETIVSDNGSCFTSEEFSVFLQNNGIKHIRSAPFHPASNGLAERAVQTVKEGIRKQTEGTLEQKVARFLLTYRITPQTTTGVAPSELLMGRRLRSKLDLVKPDLKSKVLEKQFAQKKQHDTHVRERAFETGNAVFIRNFAKGQKWLEGNIESRSGPVSYNVYLKDGRVMKRHVEHIRARSSDSVTTDVTEATENQRGKENPNDASTAVMDSSTKVTPTVPEQQQQQHQQQQTANQQTMEEQSPIPTNVTNTEEQRETTRNLRPRRDIKRPEKLNDYVVRIK